MDETDTRPSWSNYGSNVTVFAPGSNIVSASFSPNGFGNSTRSGTSMAAAHVAGLSLYFMQTYGPHTPQQMRDRITGWATQGLVRNLGEGSPNLIAFNGVVVDDEQMSRSFADNTEITASWASGLGSRDVVAHY